MKTNDEQYEEGCQEASRILVDTIKKNVHLQPECFLAGMWQLIALIHGKAGVPYSDFRKLIRKGLEQSKQFFKEFEGKEDERT